MKEKKVLVGVTGSIAAYKACELVSKLVQKGAEVRVIMTEAAREFVTPLTFRSLSGSPVLTGMFETPQQYDPVHVNCAAWTDILVIAPASANILGKIACGSADDLLSCTVMATRAPVIIAPAMNVHMYESAIVRENIGRLKTRGYHFVGPEKGYLACGYEGMGRLASTDAIMEGIAAHV